MKRITILTEWKPGKILLLLVLPALFLSCNKMKIKPVEVYPEPPVPLVKFLEGKPSPSIGVEGSAVTFNVKGLQDKFGKFQFFINQTEAEVLDAGENTVKVKIPKNASTGGSSILINGEYYFGPVFTVRGKISIDPTFNTDIYRTNGPIYEMMEWDGSTWLIAGNFTDYQNQASNTKKVPGMAKLVKSTLAFQDAGATEGQFSVGKAGINGRISSVIPEDNGTYLITGAFTQYDTITNMNNITRINQDGTVDSMQVDVVGEPPLDKEEVPTFNGGVTGNVQNAFYDYGEKEVTLIGNFSSYVSTFYERSSIGGPLLDYTKTRQLVKLKEDGSFDSTFNFNKATNESFAGGNGNIYDAIELPDGNFLVVGNFTTFHDHPANHIVRINSADGTVDLAFSGNADEAINRITRNESTGKILLTGTFKNYNGQPVNGVVMIDENGIPDPSFTFQKLDAGIVNFAGQLDNGKIIASGTFNKYGDVVRVGMAILNPDGTLASGYNNMGLFRGQINNVMETTTSTGVPGVILYGDFDRFDATPVGNIVKFKMED